MSVFISALLRKSAASWWVVYISQAFLSPSSIPSACWGCRCLAWVRVVLVATRCVAESQEDLCSVRL